MRTSRILVLFPTLALWTAFPARAQNFTAIYDGGDVVQGDFFQKIIPMSDGGYAAIGQWLPPGSTHVCVVVRLDNSFQVLWQKQVSPSPGFSANCHSLIEAPDGGLWVGHNLSSFSWVAKLSASGDVESLQRYTAASSQLAQAADGTLLLVGQDPLTGVPTIDELQGGEAPVVHSYGVGTDFGNILWLVSTPDGGYAAVILEERQDFVTDRVLKLDSGFNVQWDKEFLHGVNAMPGSILATSDGGLLLMGHTPSNGLAYFIKLDPSGNILWPNGVDPNIGGNKTDPNQATNAGGETGQAGVGRGYVVAASLNIDQGAWLVKMDVDGNLLWSSHFSNGGAEGLRSLLQDVDGTLVAAGSTQFNSRGQLMVTRVNADGTQLGNCFTLFEPTDAIVTTLDIQVLDLAAASSTITVDVQDSPYGGGDTSFVSNFCSTTGLQSGSAANCQ